MDKDLKKHRTREKLLEILNDPIFHKWDLLFKIIFFRLAAISLDSLGVYDQNGKSYGEVEVVYLTNELVMNDMHSRRLDCVFEFWPVGAKDNTVRNLCIIELEMQKEGYLENKHIRYANELVERYREDGVKVNCHIVGIYGPAFSPKDNFDDDFGCVVLKEPRNYLRLVSEDELFSTLETKVATGKKIDPWEVFQFFMLPEVVRPFSYELFLKCVDFVEKNDIILGGIHLDVLVIMWALYNKHLTEDQKREFFEMKVDPLTGEIWEKVDEARIKEAVRSSLKKGEERAEKRAEERALKNTRSIAIQLLKEGVPHEVIQRSLKVSEEWLLELEKKL
ncbi:MAG: hypothetical protein LBE27_04450 [Deltaproteobacteria bacterium]|nr:hypothetical protein [Deltaproteobacteria bacterium]